MLFKDAMYPPVGSMQGIILVETAQSQGHGGVKSSLWAGSLRMLSTMNAGRFFTSS